MSKLNIENIAKQKLTDFEYKSANSDWDSFENKLPKKKISFSKYIIAAASIAIVSIVLFSLTNNNTSNKAITETTMINNIKDSQEEPNNNNKQTYTKNDKKEIIKSLTHNNNNIKDKSVLQKPNSINYNNTEKDNQNNVEINIVENNPITVIETNEIDNYKPISTFKISKNKGCAPLEIDFLADESSSNIKYYWEFSDGFNSNGNKLAHTFTKPGVYKVKLTTTNNNNKETNSFEVEIVIYNSPKSDFSYSVFDDSYSFEGADCENQIWKFGDNSFSNEINPEHIYSHIGETVISYTAINEYGCKSESTKTINIEPVFQIANAFSPNKDGNNDEFGPIFEHPEKFNYYLYIYNASGDLIFKSLQVNENWNGKISNSNDTASKAVYLWKLIISDKHGNKINKKGKLTIK